MVATPRFQHRLSACFAWLALVLCSAATPSLTFAPSQAEVDEQHETDEHAVFVEDACGDSEESRDSERGSSSDTFLAGVSSSVLPRFIGFGDETVSSAPGQQHALGVLRALAARGPPTVA